MPYKLRIAIFFQAEMYWSQETVGALPIVRDVWTTNSLCKIQTATKVDLHVSQQASLSITNLVSGVKQINPSSTQLPKKWRIWLSYFSFHKTRNCVIQEFDSRDRKMDPFHCRPK
jgi:hypothetical protein